MIELQRKKTDVKVNDLYRWFVKLLISRYTYSSDPTAFNCHKTDTDWRVHLRKMPELKFLKNFLFHFSLEVKRKLSKYSVPLLFN